MVIIGVVEKYIIDIVWEKGWVKLIIFLVECVEFVGIIGVGSGGFVVVDMLCCVGVQVIVYDCYDCVGGLLIYGISGFKLEKDVVMKCND